MYESNNAQAFWDVPLFTEHQEVRADRVDACITNHVSKRVITLEMSCPWVTNREKKKEEKTTKYRPLRLELKHNHQGYNVKQCDIIMNVLRGWSLHLEDELNDLVGSKSKEVLHYMQKAVSSETLNISRSDVNNDYRPLFNNFLPSIFSGPLIIKEIIDSRISYKFERILKILMFVQLPF